VPLFTAREIELERDKAALETQVKYQAEELKRCQKELSELKLNLESRIQSATEAAKAIGADKVAQAYKEGMNDAKSFLKDMKAIF
jgi:F0F1-type ATP synthase membrane subunit b/b'